MQNTDIIKAAAVSLKAEYGCKKANLEKMTYFTEQAKAQGCNIVVFPELCTTGYDIFTEEETAPKEKAAFCEAADGESVSLIKALAKKLNIYITFGFGESFKGSYYNSAAIISPKEDIYIYRKIHLFGREGLFFSRGKSPVIVNTPWGKTAVGICYDTYNFPELLRYYAYKGARLYLNPTAMAYENDTPQARGSFCSYYKTTLEYNVINTGMFIVSSNLTGIDRVSVFGGGSVVMGVGDGVFKRPYAKYYAGDISCEDEGIFAAQLDLSLHNPRLFVPSKITGDIDFQPRLYNSFYSCEKNNL